MSLFDVLYAELTGGRVSAKERRAAEREFKKMAEQIQEALRIQLEADSPPRIIQAGDLHFVFHRIGEPQPGEWHLCGEPLRMREQTTLRTSPHMCRIYWPIKGPAAARGTRQEAPPPPRRPSGPNRIEAAYIALGAGPNDTAAQIRARFVALSKQFHPDTHPGDAEAESRYKEITAAYTLLKGEKLA